MSIQRRLRGVFPIFCALFLLALQGLPAHAATEKTRLRVDDYQINVVLQPHLHHMTASAKVKFTAMQDLSVAVFELHNDLRVTKVTDEKNQPLTAERVTQDSTIRIPLPQGLSKDASMTLNFEYEGQLENADNSPVPGLSLAYVGDDTSYLFYAGRWFPVNNYGLNRFTSTISVNVPAHMLVIGSGKLTVSDTAPPKKAAESVLPTKTFTFVTDKPSFPGTMVAGIFQEYKSDEAGMDLHVYFACVHHHSCAGIHIFHHPLRPATVAETEPCGIAGRHFALYVGSGDRRHGRTFDHREDKLSLARRRNCAPVVGSVDKSREQR